MITKKYMQVLYFYVTTILLSMLMILSPSSKTNIPLQNDKIYYELNENIISLQKPSQEEINAYFDRINELYPIAREIWIQMKNYNWSDEMCAGIIGNMMQECGGRTLDLQWSIEANGQYGLCQWSLSRKIDLIEKYGELPSYENQVIFMKDELYGTNGVRKQVSEKQLKDILSAETPEQAAIYFAQYFERCVNDNNYMSRQENARVAYEYFTRKESNS